MFQSAQTTAFCKHKHKEQFWWLVGRGAHTGLSTIGNKSFTVFFFFCLFHCDIDFVSSADVLAFDFKMLRSGLGCHLQQPCIHDSV